MRSLPRPRWRKQRLGRHRRAMFLRPLYGGAPGLKVVRDAGRLVRGASTLTLLAPPGSLLLRFARGEVRRVLNDDLSSQAKRLRIT